MLRLKGQTESGEQVKLLREALYPLVEERYCDEDNCECSNYLAIKALDQTKPKEGE